MPPPNPPQQKQRPMTYLGLTRSVCPECLEPVNAKILTDGVRIFFGKYCPRHGHSMALVSEDAAHYLKTREFARPGSIPRRFSTKTDKGCPQDCGLCPDHEQHTCHPIVEITDCCNLTCPICMADNRFRGFLSVEQFGKIVENLIAAEGSLENITLSGGEPSLHPDFHRLIAVANRPEISRISLVTNGLRIAGDEDFCKLLKSENIYVILQWDGTDDPVYEKLRGRPLAHIKERALSNLEKYEISVQLLFTAARNINEDQMGRAVRLLLEKNHILSLAIQPLTLTVPGIGDPMNRLTIAGVIKGLAEQTEGFLQEEDFIPLPCPNPECISLTYLLRLEDGSYRPFARFADMKKYLHLFARSATLQPGDEVENALHEIISDLWSSAAEIPDSPIITRALRRAVLEVFSKEGCCPKELIRVSEQQAKSIFIHHYMDRYNFDLARVVKCCQHYPLTDGKIMPICAFNLFHRTREANPFAA